MPMCAEQNGTSARTPDTHTVQHTHTQTHRQRTAQYTHAHVCTRIVTHAHMAHTCTQCRTQCRTHTHVFTYTYVSCSSHRQAPGSTPASPCTGFLLCLIVLEPERQSHRRLLPVSPPRGGASPECWSAELHIVCFEGDLTCCAAGGPCLLSSVQGWQETVWGLCSRAPQGHWEGGLRGAGAAPYSSELSATRSPSQGALSLYTPRSQKSTQINVAQKQRSPKQMGPCWHLKAGLRITNWRQGAGRPTRPGGPRWETGPPQAPPTWLQAVDAPCWPGSGFQTVPEGGVVPEGLEAGFFLTGTC